MARPKCLPKVFFRCSGLIADKGEYSVANSIGLVATWGQLEILLVIRRNANCVVQCRFSGLSSGRTVVCHKLTLNVSYL